MQAGPDTYGNLLQIHDINKPAYLVMINGYTLRGYCTPGQFLDCFCIFLKNYNTLVTSKICFLLVTFQGT